MLQDICDAEEVTQDAFVYLFRRLERYDPTRGSFWVWLRVAPVSRYSAATATPAVMGGEDEWPAVFTPPPTQLQPWIVEP